MLKPVDDSSKFDKGEEMRGEFVTSSAGASPAFEAAEVILNAIALPVKLTADLALDSASWLCVECNGWLRAAEAADAACHCRSLCLSPHTALQGFPAMAEHGGLHSLSCDEQQVHCKPPSIRKSHDLGVATSTRFAHGLLV